MNIDKAHLLLVQHDRLASDITSFRLRLLGYDIVSIDSGEAVPEAIDKQMPQLVLLETSLPGISGYEVIHRLRANTASATLPVLACSTDSSPDAVRQAYRAGATEYLLMPFDPAVLETRIELLLQNQSHAVA